jgi:hypothetical protein
MITGLEMIDDLSKYVTLEIQKGRHKGTYYFKKEEVKCGTFSNVFELDTSFKFGKGIVRKISNKNVVSEMIELLEHMLDPCVWNPHGYVWPISKKQTYFG